jgi:hypothetical protein
MRIVPRSRSQYAHVEWDSDDQKRIHGLQETISSAPLNIPSLKGLRIELSEHDVIPADKRHSLIEGKFFAVE